MRVEYVQRRVVVLVNSSTKLLHVGFNRTREPLLQARLPDVLGDIQRDVEERKIGDGQALALEAEGGW